MSESDMIIVIFVISIMHIPISSWHIAAIKDELRKIQKNLKEQKMSSCCKDCSRCLESTEEQYHYSSFSCASSENTRTRRKADMEEQE